jgi:hypothetical protein
MITIAAACVVGVALCIVIALKLFTRERVVLA